MADEGDPSFDFVAPKRIIFGWGRRRELGTLARSLGKRAFLVTGGHSLEANGALEQIMGSLKQEGLDVARVPAAGREPTVEDVDQAATFLREEKAGPGDMVVAVGGGSAIDLGKAIAAMAVHSGEASVKDYLEGVGTGLALDQPPLPILAAPTTAGTGSEATKNAVISSSHPRFKKSLRADGMTPTIALIDPELSVTAPPRTTAWCGMDALTQLIESRLTRRSRRLTRALAIQGLELVRDSIREAVEVGSSRPAREKMAQAALLSGMALANSGLGMAHGVAAALGVHAGVAHGLACAFMLPIAIKANRDQCWDGLADIGVALSGKTWPTKASAARAAIEFVDSLHEAFEIPTKLGELGVKAEQIPAIVQDSRGNSMAGNPREITDEELTEILEDLM